MKVKILTQNIRNTCDRYAERKPLLRESISKANADLCGFQEVVF